MKKKIRNTVSNQCLAIINYEKTIYLTGSDGNEKIHLIAKELREMGFSTFDRNGYKQALTKHNGKHIYEFDKSYLDRSHIGILILPAGNPEHIELGYMIGREKPCYVYYDKKEREPKCWDAMYRFVKKDLLFNGRIAKRT